MPSTSQGDGVPSKKKTRRSTVGSNGNKLGNYERATKRVRSQKLPNSNPIANAVVEVKNEIMSSPSRKRIRLSLKGKTMATVSVISTHAEPSPQLQLAAPPSDHREKPIMREHGIESFMNSGPSPLIEGKLEEVKSAAMKSEGETFLTPKKKIKLVLSKLAGKPEETKSVSTYEARAGAMQLNRNITTGGTKSSEAGADAPEAMVLENGADGEDDAVAAVVEELPKADAHIKPKISLPTQNGPGTNDHSTILNQRRHNAAALRSVRLPPMSSPGLLVPPGIYRGPVDSNGLVSPNAIFIDAMTTAGYTFDSRTKDPHRGSSIQRVVDDMYDSNVKLCLNFPELLPGKYLKEENSIAKSVADDAPATKESPSENHKHNAASASTKRESATHPNTNRSIAERLIAAFETNRKGEDDSQQARGQRRPGHKRSRVQSFAEMIPVSLTLPYSEEFILKRLEYVKLVIERERKIVTRHEDEEKLNIQKEHFESIGEEYSGPTTSEIIVPPIPVPPDPPNLHAMHGMETELYCNEEHPFYRSKAELVEHLDKRCFHISDGRYFGLTSCGLADQHFVGPNAPGISGLHLSSVSGLATSNTTGSSGGVPLFDPPSMLAGPKTSAALGIVSAKTSVKPSPVKSQSSGSVKKSTEPKNPKPPAAKTTTETPKKSLVPSTKNGPTVTATKHQLKLIMEEGGEESEKMRMVIIKAAVHALRAGKYENRSFRGLDRKVYPDVAKAFSVHSGLKPCAKCKSNKQGTYHCRFRRKHHFTDYDGGDSWKILEPLFEAPLGDLIIKPLKKKENPSDKPIEDSTS
jgi:hypothetical protein